MVNSAIPKYMYNLITDITPEDLRKMGVRAVGIDLDNTTVYDSGLKILSGVPEWILKIKQAGFLICIVTNTFTLRAAIIGKRLNVPYYAMSDKPKSKNVIKAAQKAGIDISEFALVGDRLFTDVVAANEAGAISIKTEPFQNEKLFRRSMEKKRDKETSFMIKHRPEFPKIMHKDRDRNDKNRKPRRFTSREN